MNRETDSAVDFPEDFAQRVIRRGLRERAARKRRFAAGFAVAGVLALAGLKTIAPHSPTRAAAIASQTGHGFRASSPEWLPPQLAGGNDDSDARDTDDARSLLGEHSLCSR